MLEEKMRTFSRSPSRTLARTRPAASEISKRSGEFESALVTRSKPVGRVVLKRNTSSSVCVRVPWLPPTQIVICWLPLNASVAESLPQVGPVNDVAEQSQIGRFHPSLQTPPLRHGGTDPLHWFCWTWHEAFTAPIFDSQIAFVATCKRLNSTRI